jgi:hypothetical protein
LILPWILGVKSNFPFKLDPPKPIFRVTEDDHQDDILQERVRAECKRLDVKWMQLSQFNYTDLQRAPSELRFYCRVLLNIIRLAKLSLELTFHCRKTYHQYHVYRLLAETQFLHSQVGAVLYSIAWYKPLRLHFACATVSTLVHGVYDRIFSIVADLPLPMSNLEDEWVDFVVSQITEMKILLESRLNGTPPMEEVESTSSSTS